MKKIMTAQEAIDELEIIKKGLKAQCPYERNSQERNEWINRVEVTMDRATKDVVRMETLGYRLMPGLKPTESAKTDSNFMHLYESMRLHIKRAERAVSNVNALVAKYNPTRPH